MPGFTQRFIAEDAAVSQKMKGFVGSNFVHNSATALPPPRFGNLKLIKRLTWNF